MASQSLGPRSIGRDQSQAGLWAQRMCSSGYCTQPGPGPETWERHECACEGLTATQQADRTEAPVYLGFDSVPFEAETKSLHLSLPVLICTMGIKKVFPSRGCLED